MNEYSFSLSSFMIRFIQILGSTRIRNLFVMTNDDTMYSTGWHLASLLVIFPWRRDGMMAWIEGTIEGDIRLTTPNPTRFHFVRCVLRLLFFNK